MKILALDISKAATGVAIGDGDGPPRTLTQGFTADRPGAVGASYAKWLDELLRREKPDLVTLEAALVLIGKRSGTAVMLLLQGLAYTTTVVCESVGVRYETISIMTWRKMFLGHGRPENPKQVCIDACYRLGWDVEGDDNQADACGVWAYAHFHHGNRKGIMRQRSESSVRRMAG